ncbi:hypothetical protein [Natronolimnohabitans innermongolicus]|uniref:DUF8159 domain-containing protein n=1 Tax=Natronolimnohabitans innermongolicus JCM 12255 TaxID=1227499 RepID=L9WW56_9EURY|nr:hypothetical protein [Natronolimnohabitans innermongolicus]ELY53642.1 hypothetical protein C493_14038 [Natronolimnohabitans innermongolicus JCM 12255]
MERRKILLGSGAALATALAGCSGSEGSGDDDSDDETKSITGSETESDDDGGNGDENGDESAAGDVPGFDESAFALESETLTVESIDRDGETVDIVAESETTNYEELLDELGSFVDDIDAAVVDADAFEDEVETLAWVVDHDGMKVVSFDVDVEWLINYRNGDRSRDEVASNVRETAE